MALVKKLSVKSVVGDVKKMVAAGDIKKSTPVMRAYGKATGIQTGTSDNGDWVAFKGEFKGINLLTGEEYGSGKLFMPDVASDLLEGMLVGEEVNGVEFGFDLLVKPDASSATGYVYEAEPLIKPAQDDTLSRLAADLPALPKALADKSAATKAAK